MPEIHCNRRSRAIISSGRISVPEERSDGGNTNRLFLIFRWDEKACSNTPTTNTAHKRTERQRGSTLNTALRMTPSLCPELRAYFPAHGSFECWNPRARDFSVTRLSGHRGKRGDGTAEKHPCQKIKAPLFKGDRNGSSEKARGSSINPSWRKQAWVLKKSEIAPLGCNPGALPSCSLVSSC
jgi:hypothetical protein